MPSTWGLSTRTNVPLVLAPVTIASKTSPVRLLMAMADIRLVILALDLAGGVFAFGAGFRDGVEFVVFIGIRRLPQQRLDQALGDEIGEAAVGRGGVRVVLHGETEVADVGIVGGVRECIRRGPSA